MRNLIVSAALLISLSTSPARGEKPAPDEKPATPAEGKVALAEQVAQAAAALEKRDSTLKPFLAAAHAYVVFPRVEKGALIVGGLRGRGIVFRAGKAIGYAQLTAAVGEDAPDGFTEVIAFADARSFDRFANNRFELGAKAGAVLVADGVGKAARYTDGVAVLIDIGDRKGDAPVLGAQKFSFVPMPEEE